MAEAMGQALHPLLHWDGQTFKLGYAILQPISAIDGPLVHHEHNNGNVIQRRRFVYDLAPRRAAAYLHIPNQRQAHQFPSLQPANQGSRDNHPVIRYLDDGAIVGPDAIVSLAGATNTDYKVASYAFTKPPLSARGVTNFLEVTGTAYV
jgi:hypothetical protein